MQQNKKRIMLLSIILHLLVGITLVCSMEIRDGVRYFDDSDVANSLANVDNSNTNNQNSPIIFQELRLPKVIKKMVDAYVLAEKLNDIIANGDFSEATLQHLGATAAARSNNGITTVEMDGMLQSNEDDNEDDDDSADFNSVSALAELFALDTAKPESYMFVTPENTKSTPIPARGMYRYVDYGSNESHGDDDDDDDEEEEHEEEEKEEKEQAKVLPPQQEQHLNQVESIASLIGHHDVNTFTSLLHCNIQQQQQQQQSQHDSFSNLHAISHTNEDDKHNLLLKYDVCLLQQILATKHQHIVQSLPNLYG